MAITVAGGGLAVKASRCGMAARRAGLSGSHFGAAGALLIFCPTTRKALFLPRTAVAKPAWSRMRIAGRIDLKLPPRLGPLLQGGAVRDTDDPALSQLHGAAEAPGVVGHGGPVAPGRGIHEELLERGGRAGHAHGERLDAARSGAR